MFESPAMDDFGRFGPTFCVLPWIHMMTRPQGTTQPCCVSSSEILQESGVPFHLSESDPDEVWNSAFYRDIRKKMRSGEKVSSCRSCYESEAVGRISYRQESNAWWADRDKREIVRRVAESEKREFSVDSRPRSLDLRLGNHCNLSCRSCEPLSSSRIVAEWSEILEKNPEFSEFWDGKPYVWAGQEDRPATVWHREKRFLNYVRKTLPEVELLYMTGGEPVLARGNYELIETCVAEGWAADIELMLNTNMTVNSPGFFESFRHFRRVQLNCSLDGFGSMNDYLRFPSRWREVSANLDSFLKLPGNIRTTVCVVVQFHNVLNLTDLLRDIDRRRAEAAPRHVNFDLILLRDPSFLSMTLLPEKIRRLAAARLRDFSRSSALCREDAVSRAGVDATIRTLSMENREAPRGLLEKNARFTSILDKARGVEMKDFIPELHAMMES